ncbi:MAG: damage-inducible protein DinB [Alphaproteobacteria bacterium]|jgi:uncharacterized damage-inducible protein DinB|nr:damage-inducible protein DinB [Alphaproteobacteria bacterium]
MLAEQTRSFARYNRWANTRLFDAVDELDDADYRADRGLFFGSIHATLNHLLVADRIWLSRLTGASPGEAPTALDAILYRDRGSLAAARTHEDLRLIAFADGLDDAAFAGSVRYANQAGEAFTQPLAGLLAHLFNHQTHHRGQIHAALTGLGRAAPPLDLIYYLRTLG